MQRPLARSLSLLALAFALACTAEPSVEVKRPAETPDSVWIQGVTVLDVEYGHRVAGMDVVLADGRIQSIQVTGNKPPAEALVVSGKGATLVPGLVDMHGHIEADSAPSWARGFPDYEANLRSYLYSGVTTLFDPADGSGDAFLRRERLASGELVGPRLFTTGPILTSVDGHPIALVKAFAPAWISWYLAPRVAVAIDGATTAEQQVDMLAAEGADAIKIVIDQIPLHSSRLSPELAKSVVERARSHDLRVVAHIGTTQDALDAAQAGVSLLVHGVYKERIPDEALAQLASFDIPVVATIEVFDRYARSATGPMLPNALERETVTQELIDSFYPPPDDFEVGELQGWLDLAIAATADRSENVRRMKEAGITILAGSDTQSGVFPGPGLHRELAKLVAAGLTPLEAIRAATLDAARFLANGQPPDFGNVAAGMRADLLLVEGDPTKDVAALQQIREVFLAGVPIERTAISNGK